ncbi:hypothetical protein ATCC90586_009393 [Pythium insidiosum]|nr:hypothetical protein ATCC90586_009393 [Pythium insidiosum]
MEQDDSVGDYVNLQTSRAHTSGELEDPSTHFSSATTTTTTTTTTTYTTYTTTADGNVETSTTTSATSTANATANANANARRLDQIQTARPAMGSTSATTSATANATTASGQRWAAAVTATAVNAAAAADYRIVSLPSKLPNQAESGETFCSNVVITSKYTTWNFLPLFMVESFKKLANAYFLLVSVLQCIPIISNTAGLPSNLPVLMFILAVDGVLAIIEDRRRHQADHEANSAHCQIIMSTYTGLTAPQFCKPTDDPDIKVIQWSELTVGTIVKLRNRETAPADLLILAVDEQDPSDPNGICYVETKSLDGETNLKLRHACDYTLHALTVQQVTNLRGFLRCENPNRVIGRFDGTLTVGGKDGEVAQQPVSIKNILLRGCQLRNTQWIYGLVINTGPDTKIMQSAAKAQPKWSSINETVNKMIIWLLIFLCALCALAASTKVVWLHTNKVDTRDLLLWEPNLVSEWFVGFGSYFLLMYQMIPVSLYVTISMVMFVQAIFMTWDIDMYYEDLDVRMIVRSMGLNEELGQISYVFSDKTGTLTCNVMEFRKCSINGISYGTGTTEIGRAALKRKGIIVPEEVTPKNGTKKRMPYVNFEDPRLTSKLDNSDNSCAEAEFFLHLSLCHTVIPETVEGSSEVRLSASSPDEQALVSGAKYFGFSFESRGLGIARVRITNKGLMTNKNADSELVEYKILDVLEFTSDRKRMSVVAQFPNGEYWILTKEGMQAVNSSDYAIGQFYFLEKLLLHHGRLNYKRMSILVGYMFYKNIVMVLSQYLYMFTTGSSGQKFYSEFGFQLYNICYTSLPIIVLGVFDYDVPWSVASIGDAI